MANRTGTKLTCSNDGAQVAVTRGGDGQVHCCGSPMEISAGNVQVRPEADKPSGPVDDPFYD